MEIKKFKSNIAIVENVPRQTAFTEFFDGLRCQSEIPIQLLGAWSNICGRKNADSTNSNSIKGNSVRFDGFASGHFILISDDEL